ncbi:MAG TPA: GWxTD domain-containing protein [Longimicrobiales bacterium]|nr:GWxTD domain-containing protein [Longimicrobiales bacterium]
MSMLSMTLVLAAAAGMTAVAQEPQPEVTVYRSWRAPNATLVEGLFRVDPELLGTTDCAYGVQLTVKDQHGTALKREQWTGRCPEQHGTIAGALETFKFAVEPATYTIEVTVFPQSQPERKRMRTLTVTGYAAEPLVSDLILAQEVSYVDSTNSARWTLQHGSIGLRTTSQIVVDQDSPRVAYYVELYPAQSAMTGAVYAVVRRADGRELMRRKLQELTAQTQAIPIAGRLSLDGLPPGAYRMETQVQLADTTIVRSHPFFVAGEVVTSSNWFHTLTDEQLEELFAPVVVWLRKSEADVYTTLPPAAQREFLARQFGPEGPTPNDGDESAIDAYLARVEQVRLRFSPRSGRMLQEPAWKTDRGRIFLMHGEPGAMMTRPSSEGGNPYEIWHYTSGQNIAYLFVDETKLGHYRLVYSNDPNEKGVADWTRRVGPEALNDLARLGIRPRTDGGGGESSLAIHQ